MKRAARPLLEEVRLHTGLTGIPVVHNAREVLISLYERTLQETRFSLPPTCEYRKGVEKITKFRLKTVRENEKRVDIERIVQVRVD